MQDEKNDIFYVCFETKYMCNRWFSWHRGHDHSCNHAYNINLPSVANSSRCCIVTSLIGWFGDRRSQTTLSWGTNTHIMICATKKRHPYRLICSVTLWLNWPIHIVRMDGIKVIYSCFKSNLIQSNLCIYVSNHIQFRPNEACMGKIFSC